MASRARECIGGSLEFNTERFDGDAVGPGGRGEAGCSAEEEGEEEASRMMVRCIWGWGLDLWEGDGILNSVYALIRGIELAKNELLQKKSWRVKLGRRGSGERNWKSKGRCKDGNYLTIYIYMLPRTTVKLAAGPSIGGFNGESCKMNSLGRR